MSQNFTARTAPNVSRYLQGLNELPLLGDMTTESAFDDSFDIANVDFLDLDAATGFPNFTSFEPDNAKSGEWITSRYCSVYSIASHTNIPILPGQQYPFNDFQAFAHTDTTIPSSVMPSSSLVQGNYQTQPLVQSPVTGDKRKASVALPASSADLEDQSRMAAEEDKRRRNTAASARFRIKKKQREQTLEKQTREMSEKLASFEAKVQQLEMENKWLKSLITEKSPNVDFSAMKMDSEQRSTEKRVDGVGTEEGDADTAAEVDVEA